MWQEVSILTNHPEAHQASSCWIYGKYYFLIKESINPLLPGFHEQAATSGLPPPLRHLTAVRVACLQVLVTIPFQGPLQAVQLPFTPSATAYEKSH